MSSKPSRRFADAAEICDELGITRRTLRNWVRRGQFPPPLRLNLRKHVWLRASLENFYHELANKAEGSNR